MSWRTPPVGSEKMAGRLRFSLLSLLAFVSTVTVLMLPLSYYFRATMARDDLFELAIVELESPDGSPDQRAFDLDKLAIYKQLLNRPEIRGLQGSCTSPDQREWLSKHLSIEAAECPAVIELHATGQRTHVKSSELRILLQATIEVVQEECEKEGKPFSLVVRSSAALSR